jgi:hypothetical protein
MSGRATLPARRPSITCKVIWQTPQSDHRFHVSMGFSPTSGELLEVFYADGQKTGTQLRYSIEEACVLISLLLQHGVTPAQILKSLSTETVFGAPQPATVFGAIAQAIAKESEVA